MIQFTKEPENFSPVTEPIIFGIDAGSEPCDVELAIFETAAGGGDEQVGTLKLYGITATEIDIAPYLHRFEEIMPLLHPTSALLEAPTRQCRVEADGVCSSRFTISDNTLTPLQPSWLSSMPQHRTIGHEECDEVRLFGHAGTTFNVEIISDGGDEIYLSHTSPSGAAVLYLAAADLAADASSVEVNIIADGQELLPIVYSLVPRRNGQIRLAWRSCA